jgi:hypothetical protein
VLKEHWWNYLESAIAVVNRDADVQQSLVSIFNAVFDPLITFTVSLKTVCHL